MISAMLHGKRKTEHSSKLLSDPPCTSVSAAVQLSKTLDIGLLLLGQNIASTTTFCRKREPGGDRELFQSEELVAIRGKR